MRISSPPSSSFSSFLRKRSAKVATEMGELTLIQQQQEHAAAEPHKRQNCSRKSNRAIQYLAINAAQIASSSYVASYNRMPREREREKSKNFSLTFSEKKVFFFPLPSLLAGQLCLCSSYFVGSKCYLKGIYSTIKVPDCKNVWFEHTKFE